jgi:hypothetical protein
MTAEEMCRCSTTHKWAFWHSSRFSSHVGELFVENSQINVLAVFTMCFVLFCVFLFFLDIWAGSPERVQPSTVLNPMSILNIWRLRMSCDLSTHGHDYLICHIPLNISKWKVTNMLELTVGSLRTPSTLGLTGTMNLMQFISCSMDSTTYWIKTSLY